jgi:ABC-type Na+ efflux pump permease subunit
MNGFGLIAWRDICDLTHGTAFRFVAGALTLAAAALAAGAVQLTIRAPAVAQGMPDGPPVAALVGMMLYFATLLPFLALLWVFAGAILVKEKASGHLETLLATPLSTRALWLAKTAAIVVPGLILATVASALIVVSLLVAARAQPDAAALPLPAALLVVCWIGNPLLLTGLSAVTVILSMRAGADAGIVPSFGVGFLLMVAVPAGGALRVVDPGSWVFAAGYLGAAAIEWIVVLALAQGLTKERIVLSSREA